ncbi:hypothetical protein GGR51DRAFT_568381 [Nemania sp. FL0031]|nr:hypothetical protein GGR51DRAFT_568381 [Nemania sp. FL0031]
MAVTGSTFSTQIPLMEVENDTSTELTRHWVNPSPVLAMVLTVLGESVIQKALAQSTGGLLTPVCFSFGWVSYSLSSLKNSFGNGRLLPPPDYPVKVFDVESGRYRNNENWLIGRILRDHVSWISDFQPAESEIRIAVFEAKPLMDHPPPHFYNNMQHLVGIVVIVAQLMIAAIPAIQTQGHEWGILAITGFGTLLATAMGSLPQWRVEKIPKNRHSDRIFALTAGRGSRDVMIIKGEGCCLDLKELAILHSAGAVITRSMCIFQVLGWCLILISLASIRTYTWYLIAVGAIGWVHNIILADLKRGPKRRNLPLRLLNIVSTRNVMDGLMDLEKTHEGCGEALVSEFFPGKLCPDEEEWWKAERGERVNTKYHQKRMEAKDPELPPLISEHRLDVASGGHRPPKPKDFNADSTGNQEVSITVSPAPGAGSTSDSRSGSKMRNKGDNQSGLLRPMTAAEAKARRIQDSGRGNRTELLIPDLFEEFP